VTLLPLVVSGYPGALMVSSWQAVVAWWPPHRHRQPAKPGPPALVAGRDGARGGAGLLGVPGFRPAGPPFGPLMLSPLQWQDLVLIPVIGVVACFTGPRLHERLLHRPESEKAG
jgi:hypothetical protein